MYKIPGFNRTTIKGVESYEGESIEGKVRRIVAGKEPITDGAPLIYTERKDGVQPSYNIRTDRWEVALDAMQSINKGKIAEREAKGKVVEMKPKEGEDAGGKSIQGTDK